MGAPRQTVPKSGCRWSEFPIGPQPGARHSVDGEVRDIAIPIVIGSKDFDVAQPSL